MSALSTVDTRLFSAAVLAEKHSAPVTHIWSRVVGTLVMLLVIVGIYTLMWRGWKRRQARQADIAELPAVPAEGFSGEGIEATYVSTTSEGDWLDRIAVHSLGERSAARVHVAGTGVLIERDGADDVFIPAGMVRGVRLSTGMAGKYLREDGLVVITWQHGDHTLDSGLKPRHGTDELLQALEAHLAVTATERPAQ